MIIADILTTREKVGLAASAKRVGANVKEWRASYEPIPGEDWVEIEAWQDGRWRPLEQIQDVAALVSRSIILKGPLM